MTLGMPWIKYLHDSYQCNDALGLEQVFVNTWDMDNDGQLNFGSKSLEIVFAMTEGP